MTEEQKRKRRLGALARYRNLRANMTEEEKALRRAKDKERYRKRMEAMTEEEKARVKRKRRAYYMAHREAKLNYRRAKSEAGEPMSPKAQNALVSALADSVQHLRAMAPLFLLLPKFKERLEYLAKAMAEEAERRRKRLERLGGTKAE